MNILSVGVFDPKLIHSASPYCGDDVFAKGFERNGHLVTRFDYRANLRPDTGLIKLAEEIKPDIFWFGKCERISPETVRVLKRMYPHSRFCKWAADVRDNPTDFDLGHLVYMDLFAATYAGEYLKKHRAVMSAESKAVSIFTFTDSEFYRPVDVHKDWLSDVVWTGRKCCGDNPMRDEIISVLETLKSKHTYEISIHGLTDWLQFPEYLYAISGTKIGIGSNSYNRRKYSSDRLGNYTASGTFYMSQYIEGIEECFKQGETLEWFKNTNEMQDKIKYYIEHDIERSKIANASRDFVLKHFDAKPLVTNLLNVLDTGKSNNSWDEIY